MTPLLLAAQQNYYEHAEVLLRYGADSQLVSACFHSEFKQFN